jgi:hypothetical protein
MHYLVLLLPRLGVMHLSLQEAGDEIIDLLQHIRRSACGSAVVRGDFANEIPQPIN